MEEHMTAVRWSTYQSRRLQLQFHGLKRCQECEGQDHSFVGKVTSVWQIGLGNLYSQ